MKKKSTRKLITVICLVVLNGLFFSILNPNNVNSIILIVGFLFLGLTLYSIIELILYLIFSSGLKIKNRKRIAVFISILLVGLLGLQSIGQLSLKDILVITPLWILLFIYITYIRPRVYF